MVLSILLWVFGLVRVISINLRIIICETSKKLKLYYIFLGWLIICFAPPTASAVLLQDWICNIDGTVNDSLSGDSNHVFGLYFTL